MSRIRRAVAVGTRQRASSRGRWSRRNTSRRSRVRRRSRIGRAATRCEIKVRAVAAQSCCGSGCSSGRLDVFPTGVSPRRTLSVSESGDRAAAIPADMVVREGERSREGKSTKYLRPYALTQVERRSTYVKAVGVSRGAGGSTGELDIAGAWDKAKNPCRGKGAAHPG